MQIIAEQSQTRLPQSTFLTTETQSSFKTIVNKYFDVLCKQLESENQRLRDLEKAHRRLIASRGDVPQDRLDRYETYLASFNKLKTSTVNLAEMIDRDLPVLAPKEEVEDSKTTIELLTIDFGKYFYHYQSIYSSIYFCRYEN